jgi:hypothetical protein
MSGKQNWGILPIVVKYFYYVILMFPWLQSLLLVHMYILLSLSFYVFMKHRTVNVPYIMQMKILYVCVCIYICFMKEFQIENLNIY